MDNLMNCQKCIFCGFPGFEQFQTAQPKTEERSAETVQNILKDDSISRKAAIEAAEKESQVDGAYGYMDTKSIIDMLNDLPSVQSNQKRGKWISIHDDIFADKYYCSCCKMEPICNDTEYILSNFCPNCGARME